MKTRILPALLLLAVSLAACNKNKSPTAPTPTTTSPPPTTTPTPTPSISRFNLWGFVRNVNTGSGVPNARITISSTSTQTNVATTANGEGYYVANNVGVGGPYTVTIEADRHNRFTESGVMLAQDASRDWRILPFWTYAGTGDTVFDMPSYVSRVRIIGDYPSYSTNFVVRIAGRLIVNELLGTGWGSTHFEGVYLTSGGVVEITISRDVRWEFRQEQ